MEGHNLRETSSCHHLLHRFHRRPFLHGSLAKVFLLSIERNPGSIHLKLPITFLSC
jgi:hypothetical protein